MTDEEFLIRALEQNIQDIKNLKYCIFGFGHYGKLLKSILNTYYSIKEDYVIDTNLSHKFESIHTPDILKRWDGKKGRLLICAVDREKYEQMKQLASEYIDERVCVDCCFLIREHIRGLIEIQQMKQNEWKNYSIERYKKAWTKYKEMMPGGNEYRAKKTKSVFYLPLALSDFIQREIFLEDDYFESAILHELFDENKMDLGQYIDRDSIVLDIGANIGNHTLYYAKELHIEKIIAFEPNEISYDILKKNIALNNIEEKVQTYNIGLADIDGNADYGRYDCSNMGGISLLKNKDGCIKLRRLDEFEIKSVSYIKIDVEGMELSVLNGAKKTLELCHPIIQVESFKEKFQALKSFLDNFGYSYYPISDLSDYVFFPKALSIKKPCIISGKVLEHSDERHY